MKIYLGQLKQNSLNFLSYLKALSSQAMIYKVQMLTIALNT